MEKHTFNHLDVDVYSEKLENGLSVFIAPKPNMNNIYMTFTTDFGSSTIEFVPIGKKEMTKVPDGVAHFLEHKVFEQENGTDALSYFTSHGCQANASTDSSKTLYNVSGMEHFEDNLNYLLDFVQSPYFTDENIEKEKGIIVQEIGMYEDDPYRIGYEKVIYNTLVNDPMRYRVIGSVDSVNAITKEDLYTCYNTFYHPSNMFVVVTGNVDPKITLDIIRKNQSKKDFKKQEPILVKEYEEPNTVYKEYEKFTMNVSIPKLFVTYKFPLDDFKDYSEYIFRWYLSIFISLKLGSSSLFAEEIKKEKLSYQDISYGMLLTDHHLVLILEADSTEYPDKLAEKIQQELSKKEISLEDFERRKKVILSSCIYMMESIYSLNNMIISDYIHDRKVRYDIYDNVKDLNLEEMNQILDRLSFDYHSQVVIEPEKR